MNATLDKNIFDYIKKYEYCITKIEYIAESFTRISDKKYKRTSPLLALSVNDQQKTTTYTINPKPNYKNDAEWFNNFIEFIENSIEIPIEDFTQNNFHYLTEDEIDNLPPCISVKEIQKLISIGYSKKSFYDDYYIKDYYSDFAFNNSFFDEIKLKPKSNSDLFLNILI